MKRNLLILLTFLSLSGYSQSHYVFPEGNAVWNIMRDGRKDFCWDTPTAANLDFEYSIVMGNDTIINSITYKQLRTPYFKKYPTNCDPIPVAERNKLLAIVRQDKVQKKVFLLKGSNEVLLYDFSMEVGDTLKGVIQTSTVDTVKSIDSVLLGDGYHKVWHFRNGFAFNIIEGIGAPGLLEPFPPDAIGTFTWDQTRCFKMDDKTIFPASGKCGTITGMFENKPVINQTSIFPNPSNGSFTINSKENMTSIRICDLLGKVILHQQINNQSTHKVNDLQKGTYILTIFDKNDQQTNQKIIICDE